MSYLIFTTESAAYDRAEAEGIAQNLPYYRDGGKTRYVSLPSPCVGGWALEVTGYQLSEAEQAEVVTEVEWPEEPAEE